MAGVSAATPACLLNGGSGPNYVQCLPSDILKRCFAGLSHTDLLAASTVCKEWRSVATSDFLWQMRFEVRGSARQSGVFGTVGGRAGA
jgi:hypothetical protein